MLNLRFTNQFKKDFKLAQKRGIDLSDFERIVDKLRRREPLEEKYKDHPLSGSWKNYRDFHLHPDLVVIYCIKENELIIQMVRMGSHSDLFNK